MFYFTNTKHDLIHKFEINLSQYVRTRGFSVRAMHPYADVARLADAGEKRGGALPYYTQDKDWPRNPTHYFWRTLIVQVPKSKSKQNQNQNHSESVIPVPR